MSLNLPEISDLFKKIESLNILVIGDVMIDSYIWGKVERISPEAPVPIVAVNKRENRLGGAANVALNIQALGANPILCSVIGNDAKAKTFFELLADQKLEQGGIICSNERLTTTKFRIIGNHTQMIRVDEEMEKAISEFETNDIISHIRSFIESGKIDAIIFEDYDKGIISGRLIREIAQIARERNIPVLADPKKKNFNEYKNITLLKPNLKELKEGLKIDFNIENLKEIEDAVEKLQINNQIEIVMLTLSEAGTFLSICDGKSILEKKLIPSHVRNIADVSGAGDTVISVAAAFLALKLQPSSMAAIANLAGGLVCEEVGVVPVNREKLLKETVLLKSL